MKRSYVRLCMTVLMTMGLDPTPALTAQGDLGLYLNSGELVEAASRYPKPLSQVAENVSVITAQEIEAQHPHDLGEVLSQIPGLFILGMGQDVGSLFNIYTQGSEFTHTLVLIDGVRLNSPGAGKAFLHGLPPGIIKRIEIIRGPASSVWGSSLGGVINIITKEAGREPRPRGQATVSLGERSTTEVNGQAAGAIGPLGYYLYGGHQETDGHVEDHWFGNEPLYAKLNLPLSRLDLGATIGHSDPFGKVANIPATDETYDYLVRSTFTTAYLDAPLGSAFNVHLALSRFVEKFYYEVQALGLTPFVPAGTLQWDDDIDSQSDAMDARLTWNGKGASAVVGFESGRARRDFTEEWPASVFTRYPQGLEERRALFANATLSWGRFSVTPGVRYDYISTSDEAVSPSLGATCRLSPDTLLRATVARGFNAPYLEKLYNPYGGNPDLKPEYVDSVQAGVETVAVPYLRLSATLFHHRVIDVWSPDDAGMQVNQGIERRRGVELEANTQPWRRFSLGASAALVSTDSASQDDDTMYAASLIARYDRPELLSLRLAGRYIWFNDTLRGGDGKFDDFIWDLAVSREVYTSPGLRAELFGVVRNLFNGSQYWISSYANPERWVEVGVGVKF